jgi:glyoxylase-like metal-dependent hydrolase (beta-lactamase superfamily II)
LAIAVIALREVDMTDMPSVNRRDVLKGSAATLLAATAPLPALAAAPMRQTQAPIFYRFKIGAFEATAISDGPLDLGEPKAEMFGGLGPDEFRKALDDNFLPADKLLLQQNALIVNTGREIVLFDTGLGPAKMMGGKSGRLLATLEAANIAPGAIDAVVLTHAHPDHCWGLMTEESGRNFPNAKIYMMQSEFDFFTNEANATDDMMKAFVAGVRKQLLPNRERITFIKDGQEILPGIQAIATPGHTVGHTSYMITSEGKSLCNAGDIVHHHVLSMQKPRAEFAFDADGKQGAQTRLRMLDMMSADKTRMLAFHFPWPGIGYVARQGDGYRYVPEPLETVL